MIVTIPAKNLRVTARKVTSFNNQLKELEAKMRKVAAATNALGLAAPQIGVDAAAALVPLPGGLTFIVNPEIDHTAGRTLSLEGCLSIPNKQFLVVRHQDITFRYQDVTGECVEISLIKNFDVVRVIEHEIDHLKGILIDDFAIGSPAVRERFYRHRNNNLSCEQLVVYMENRNRLTVREQEVTFFLKTLKNLK